MVVPVGGVGEPDGTVVGVDDHVVDAVEGVAVEGGDERVGGVGRGEIGDEHDPFGAGVRKVTLGAEKDPGFVIYAAVGEGEVRGRDVFCSDGGRVRVVVVEAGQADGFAGGDEGGV